MKRIRLTVAYDGTAYHGFQKQEGYSTIEGVLNERLFELTGENIQVTGASRTDAGVHARGNIAVFDTASTIPPERFGMALNTRLPADIRIMRSDEVDPSWNPHTQKAIKTYSYRICNEAVYDPLTSRYAMSFVRKLDLAAMQEAAKLLEGEHDFTSFSCPASQVLQNGGSAVRRIDLITVESKKDGIKAEKGVRQHLGEVTITVKGNGFLYNMVRIIVGTLLEVGTGRFAPQDITRMLEAKDRTKAGLTAPPEGLELSGILYVNE